MFKKLQFVAIAIMLAGCAFSVAAQEAPTPTTPSISDNATPMDNSLKLRSVELERVKRDAEKTATLRREDGKELNFSIVKEDFEGIQREQLEIISAYTTQKEIDYKAISRSADKITEMAVRLRGNVFEPKEEAAAKKSASEKENPFAGKSVRDLIVALDNAIGEVVSSPMWQKLAVVDAETAKLVEASVVNVIKASGALWIESGKMATK